MRKYEITFLICCLIIGLNIISLVWILRLCYLERYYDLILSKGTPVTFDTTITKLNCENFKPNFSFSCSSLTNTTSLELGDVINCNMQLHNNSGSNGFETVLYLNYSNSTIENFYNLSQNTSLYYYQIPPFTTDIILGYIRDYNHTCGINQTFKIKRKPVLWSDANLLNLALFWFIFIVFASAAVILMIKLYQNKKLL